MEDLSLVDKWALASNITTVIFTSISIIAVPVAMYLHFKNESKERDTETKELEAQQEESRIEREQNYSKLNSEYRKLELWLGKKTNKEVDQHDLLIADPEIARRQMRYYATLINLFEESFILFHRLDDPEYKRMWNTWADTIEEWLERPNFRKVLPSLLKGEDHQFVLYIQEKLKTTVEKTPESRHEEIHLNQVRIHKPVVWYAPMTPE